jgi:hypothetical protein
MDRMKKRNELASEPAGRNRIIRQHPSNLAPEKSARIRAHCRRRVKGCGSPKRRTGCSENAERVARADEFD